MQTVPRTRRINVKFLAQCACVFLCVWFLVHRLQGKRCQLCDAAEDVLGVKEQVQAYTEGLLHHVADLGATMATPEDGQYLQEKYAQLHDMLMKIKSITLAKTKSSQKPRYGGTLVSYQTEADGMNQQGSDRLDMLLSFIIDRPKRETSPIHFGKDFSIHFVEDNLGQNTTFNNTATSLGATLNDAISTTTRRFVAIVPFSEELPSEDYFKRLVDVAVATDADVVAGSVLDVASRKWYRGCYQSSLRFHKLKLVEGYRESERGCLRCDHPQGTFVARRDFLRRQKFNDKLADGIYLDFFLKIKNLAKVLVCPDVMFSVDVQRLRNNLATFAELWDIKQIVWPDQHVTWFGCRADSSTKTKQRCLVGRGMAVPPCCRRNLEDAVTDLHRLCEKHNIALYLAEGSLLGAVKLQRTLPWDRDVDLSISLQDFEKFKSLHEKVTHLGMQMKISEELRKSVLIIAHGWHIEINCHEEAMANYTLVQFANLWMHAPANPGAYVYRRYGNGLYKHAEHWTTLGMRDGYQAYESGRFSTCSSPGHHACLEQLPPDGDLPFKTV